jgi:glycosyltransferase involved in cell wall biosynthesis
MYTRAAVAAATWGLPLVLKLVNDPAYERARSLGRFSGTLEEFQEFGGDPVVDALKLMRDHTVARAGRVVIPSRYLARIAAGWGIAPERVRVVPNPAPHVAAGVDRAALRRRFGFGRPTFVFAGRVVAQKNVPLAVTAIRHVPEASLVVIGDGPEEAAVASAIALHGLGDQVVRKSALDRAAAIEWVRAADAAVLPSDWENFPHAAVEALAVGTPVVATSVGGVPEIVSSGVNGLLVPPGDERALAEAMGSVAHDPRLVARLRVGARASADRYRPELAFEAIERALGESL